MKRSHRKYLKDITKRITEPLSDRQLSQFIESHKIAITGEDFEGRKYITEGQLNQAAWAGEKLHILLAEIMRLRNSIKVNL